MLKFWFSDKKASLKENGVNSREIAGEWRKAYAKAGRRPRLCIPASFLT
jgi:hypothetical protein